MGWVLLMEDGSSVSELVGSVINSFIGGDWLFFGIVIMLLLAVAFIFGKAKTGTAVVIGMGFLFFISLFNPVFWFGWWLGLAVGAFVLINALRKQITGG